MSMHPYLRPPRWRGWVAGLALAGYLATGVWLLLRLAYDLFRA